ncbi:phage head closure protein [uncultured Pseudomonas sp.]|uniref:phage head closure protein n=1 Tax=uncultured Pseudomonas sp. TaxID=114707 RepID=UPI0025F57718|nr:phage head closure protein [uncultured Pseudomonas sp.]
MRAGQLRQRVMLQRDGRHQDPDTGEMISGWSNLTSKAIPCSVEPVSGREFIAGQATQNEVTARIVIRYRAGVTSGMRAVHRDVIYNIEAVLPDKNSGREYLTLMVSGGLAEG